MVYTYKQVSFCGKNVETNQHNYGHKSKLKAFGTAKEDSSLEQTEIKDAKPQKELYV